MNMRQRDVCFDSRGKQSLEWRNHNIVREGGIVQRKVSCKQFLFHQEFVLVGNMPVGKVKLRHYKNTSNKYISISLAVKSVIEKYVSLARYEKSLEASVGKFPRFVNFFFHFVCSSFLTLLLSVIVFACVYTTCKGNVIRTEQVICP